MYSGNTLNQCCLTGSDPPLPSFTNRYSMDLDGIDDAVNIDGVARVLSATTVGTLSAWVRPVQSPPATNERILGFGESTSLDYLDFYAGNTGYIRADCRIGGVFQWRIQSVPITPFWLPANKWTHIAVVQDGVIPVIYINGSIIATFTVEGVALPAWFNAFPTSLDQGRIGSYPGGSWVSSNFYEGMIDEVSIWNTALSAADVATLATAPSNLKTALGTTPVAWWRMGDSGYFFNNIWEIPNQMKLDNYSKYSMGFDGMDDGVSCGLVSEIEGLTTVTISAWIKHDGTGSWDMVCFKNPLLGLFQWGTGSIINFKTTTVGNGAQDVQTSAGILDGNWHHLCGTYDGATQKIYVDGVLDNSIANAGGAISTSAAKFWIGIQDGAAIPWEGGIDDVAIWSTVLDADTVESIYHLGAPNDLTLPASYTDGSGVDKSGDLIGYWRMGESAGWSGWWTIPDDSVNSNNGNSMNMAMSARATNAPDNISQANSINMDYVDRVENTP